MWHICRKCQGISASAASIYFLFFYFEPLISELYHILSVHNVHWKSDLWKIKMENEVQNSSGLLSWRWEREVHRDGMFEGVCFWPPWLLVRAGWCWLEALAAPGRWWALLCCSGSLELVSLGSNTQYTHQKKKYEQNARSVIPQLQKAIPLKIIYVENVEIWIKVTGCSSSSTLTCNMSLGSPWISLTRARRRHL